MAALAQNPFLQPPTGASEREQGAVLSPGWLNPFAGGRLATPIAAWDAIAEGGGRPQQEGLYSRQAVADVRFIAFPELTLDWCEDRWILAPKRQTRTSATKTRSTAVIDRSRELRWLKEHGAHYAGKWVALKGDDLISSGDNAKEVFEAAAQSGVPRPLVVRVESEDALPFGGW